MALVRPHEADRHAGPLHIAFSRRDERHYWPAGALAWQAALGVSACRPGNSSPPTASLPLACACFSSFLTCARGIAADRAPSTLGTLSILSINKLRAN